MTRVVAMLLALLTLGGCGSRPVLLSGPSAGLDPVTQGVQTADRGPAEIETVVGAAGATTEVAMDPVASAPQRFGELPLKVRLEPACAVVGGTLTATIHATGGAAIAIAISYSDGQAYGQFGTFRADANGDFVYPWSIPPVAPSGPGKLLLGISDEQRRESAGGIWPFEVADPAQGCEEGGS